MLAAQPFTPEPVVAPHKASETCQLYLPSKKRFCKFTKYPGDDRFCCFHRQSETRIPCPLDPQHTVESRELETHLKKCTSKKSETIPSWYMENINMTLKAEDNLESTDFSLREQSWIDIVKIIDIVRHVTAELVIRKDVQSHSVMDQRVDEGIKMRHSQQQSSLIGQLDNRGLLETTDIFVEWGAGRAEFSRYINRALLIPAEKRAASAAPYFLLIDRDKVRLKHDRRILDDCEASGLDTMAKVKREKVDIAHVHLDKLIDASFEQTPEAKITSVSKHLCGAATDLTINCLLQSSRASIHGIMIALCCHHRCSWSALHPVSRAFLERNGIGDAHKFKMLKDMSGWATNALRRGMDPESSGLHWTGLSHNEREGIGLSCKRTIDLARVEALKAAGFQVELLQYVESDVTRESILLIAQGHSGNDK